MKFCTHCGNEIMDEAVICPKCGCAVKKEVVSAPANSPSLLQQLSVKLHTNAIIWIVIGALQILGGLFINWFLLVVGVLNIISSVQDMKYSKTVLENPQGIIKKFEPLAGPIIVLVYNLVIGGIIGVAGSVYYFVAVRGFVMQNKTQFEEIEGQAI